jgi:uncharacterized protein with GYD domain
MATFVVLAGFTDQGLRNVKETIGRAEAFKEMAKKSGVTVKDMYWTLGQYDYWTLGQYDVIAICEAPDDEAATALSLSVCSRGNVRSKTLRVQSYSDVPRKRTDSSIERRGLDYYRLQRVFEFIEAHLEDDITVETLASTACLSRFHFARAFKASTGKAPHQFISVKRLELAKSLLTEGRRSLMDVALSCHFSSQANFSRAFHRATGITPGQYRAMATWPTFISQFRQRAPALSSAAGGRYREETRRAVPSRHRITHRL